MPGQTRRGPAVAPPQPQVAAGPSSAPAPELLAGDRGNAFAADALRGAEGKEEELPAIAEVTAEVEAAGDAPPGGAGAPGGGPPPPPGGGPPGGGPPGGGPPGGGPPGGGPPAGGPGGFDPRAVTAATVGTYVARAQTVLRDDLGASWNNAKSTLLKSNVPGVDTAALTDLMKGLSAFRKTYVDGKIEEIREDVPGLLAKSVGSTDVSSDYDITFSVPGNTDPSDPNYDSKNGPGADVRAVQRFNTEVAAEMTRQPGTVFDTNIYAKDFGAVRENISADVKGSEADRDTNLPQAADVMPEVEALGNEAAKDNATMDVEAASASGEEGQDVGALLKQRRYMDAVTWDTYCKDTLAAIDDVAVRSDTEGRMREADGLFLQFLDELMTRIDAKSAEAMEAAHFSAEEEAALTAQGLDPKNLADARVVALLKEKKLAEFAEGGEDNKDLQLSASNEIYLEHMTAIRVLQEEAVGKEKKVAKLRVEAAAAKAAGKQKALEGIEHSMATLLGDLATMRADIKSKLSQACFFAAEAYQTEGAIRHIVAGQEAAKAKKEGRDVAPMQVTNAQYLQSFNEQMGDFMKDMGHYADDGEAFYRSCKYLGRMWEAFDELRKAGAEIKVSDAAFVAGLPGSCNDESTGLLAIRKGNGEYKAMAEADKQAKARLIAASDLGVANKGALIAKVLKLSVEVNAAARGQE